MMIGGRLFGIQVIASPYMTEWRQVRFPRSKKSRIRKKFAKDRRNYRLVDVAYLVQGVLHGHPQGIAKLVLRSRTEASR